MVEQDVSLEDQVAMLKADKQTLLAELLNAKDVMMKLEADVEDRDKVIEGLQAWKKVRNDAIRVHEPGSEVKLGRTQMTGVVREVRLVGGKRVQYLVSRWSPAGRDECLVESDEVDACLDDPLLPMGFEER